MSMVTDLTGVKTALAAAVQANVTAVVVQGLRWPAPSITPVTFCVVAADVEYVGNEVRWISAVALRCRLYTGSASQEARAWDLLDTLKAASGSGSVAAAIEVDRTLGGKCSNLTVSRWSGDGIYAVGGSTYVGAQIDVLVT